MATAVLPAVRAPKGSMLLGHLPEYRRDPLDFLTRAARRYGDVVPLRFGPSRLVFFNDPAAIEEILVTKNRSFIKGLTVEGFRATLGNGLFTAEGDAWLRQRRMMQPAFHRQRIAAYGDVMGAYAGRMLDRWGEGGRRDVHQDMTRLTLEVAAKTLFDVDVSGDTDEVGQALNLVIHETNVRMTSLFETFAPPWLPTPHRRRLKAGVRRLDAIIYRYIDERRASGEDRGDLLSMLVRAQDDHDGTRMTARQVRDEAITLFIAGHETTALALTWALYLLARRPDAQERLAAESDDVLGGRLPAAADMPRLPYTEMVVQESLRLYPPAWANGRQAVEDVTIAGYPVRAGQSVIVSPWVTQRDPRFFERPHEFRPERWAGGLAKRLPRFAYYPFGGGPRLCIGQGFALMEAVLVLAAIAGRYRVATLPGHETVQPEVQVSLRPRGGMPLGVARR